MQPANKKQAGELLGKIGFISELCTLVRDINKIVLRKDYADISKTLNLHFIYLIWSYTNAALENLSRQ